MLCNALSGWGSISTRRKSRWKSQQQEVSMPSRAGASFLLEVMDGTVDINRYQCPFGLVLHFYKIVKALDDNFVFVYQCPFGLKLHFYMEMQSVLWRQNQSRINALSG